ncbi:hypothetical protein ACFV0O_34290 [Kitasatospora sp. NPDC059577]|uniref:hypothetical protein n=1 Tax=unclassified Kitasatospora TaxID=2633591 RepID=UPI00369C5265
MADSRFSETITALEGELPGIEARRRGLEDELAAVVAHENALRGALESLRALSGLPLPQIAVAVENAAPLTTREEVDAAPPSQQEQRPVELPAAETEALPTQGQGQDGDQDRAPLKRAATAKKAAGKKAAGKGAAKKTAAAKKTTAKKTTAKKATAKKTATKETTAKETTAKTAPTKKAAAATRTPAKKATSRARVTTAARKPGTTTATAAGEARTAEPQTHGTAETGTAEAGTASRRRSTGVTAEKVLAVLAGAERPLRAREVATELRIDGGQGAVNALRTMLERLTKAGRAQRPGRGLYAKLDG